MLLALLSACGTHHVVTTATSPSTKVTTTTPPTSEAPSATRDANAPTRDGSAARRYYVERYRSAAIANRERYGIPAAITLGQGILESGGGTSFLARNANNHFGIKANKYWDGPTQCKPGESVPYRKYDSVADCYADHARFLQQKRYAPLYELKITDYKGWARTLKKCGYATDPKYADKLIHIIELYNLHEIDSE